MFESLELLSTDAILGLIAEYKNDTRLEKIDLGVGVYRTMDGKTPVLNVVKKAEQMLVNDQESKVYIGTAGSANFNSEIQKLIFGEIDLNDRMVTIQAPGGSGSLRVAAEMILRASPSSSVWVSEPTWANHMPLLSSAGVSIKPYPYYDFEKHVIKFDEMLDTLRNASASDIVLLHACCHNPTGLDLSKDQWQLLTDIVIERDLIPFVDIAYQGFADGLDEDVYGIRHMTKFVSEMIVSSSCSKNFGLYRDRVGALSILAKDKDSKRIIDSQINNVVRTIYSVPPDHGAAVVSLILNNEKLRNEWILELAEMRERLKSMRIMLYELLLAKAPKYDFSHLVRATGMFCFLGVTEEQVKELKKDFGIYMVNSSRINIAGITPRNVNYLANSIIDVLQ
ncbi:MAG: aromatic amino acid aminotransferase [Gammaproteobacteria bacterium]|nr:aromatic amino acid aminotransferase [Gammaproteobacteria bacterium]